MPYYSNKRGKDIKLFIQQEPDSTYLEETHLNQIEHRKLKRGWMTEGIHPHLIKKKKSTGNPYEQESMYFLPLFL